jgi:hypothetical protein
VLEPISRRRAQMDLNSESVMELPLLYWGSMRASRTRLLQRTVSVRMKPA